MKKLLFLLVLLLAYENMVFAQGEGEGEGEGDGWYTAILYPSCDNSIYSESGDISNGAGQYLFCGMNGLGDKRRTLLYFDTHSIPSDAYIQSAILRLTENGFQAAPIDVRVYRLYYPWGEGTSDAPGEEDTGALASDNSVTWFDRYWSATSPIVWTYPGGDIYTGLVATTNIAGNGVYTWDSFYLRNLVEGWVNTGWYNYGLLLVSPEVNPLDAKRFASRENPIVADRPQLIVFYQRQVFEGENWEGEGIYEGIYEGEGVAVPSHTADQNGDYLINLSELLRVIQLFNLLEFHCDLAGDDGYNPGIGDQSCTPHASDYNPQDWAISLSELLRLIQFYNLSGFYSCTGVGEDGFCAGTP